MSQFCHARVKSTWRRGGCECPGDDGSATSGYGATGDAFDTPQGRQLQFVQALIVGVGELTEG